MKGVLCLAALSALAVLACGAPLPAGLVRTPSGVFPAECVHSIPSGATMERNPATGRLHVSLADGTLHAILPKCESGARASLPSDYDGWEAYTAYNDPQNKTFDSFLGYFSVPDKPKQTPQVLYIFTGLQNFDWIPRHDPERQSAGFDIIQPVLQYPCDYDLEWCIKSWYVTLDDGAIASDPVKVNAGDLIFGNMSRIGSDAWYIGCYGVSPSGQKTVETVTTVKGRTRLTSQPWAYNTLECYGCENCATYPTIPSVFSKLQLTQGSTTVAPTWLVNPKPSSDMKCKEGVAVASPSTQTIYFNGPPAPPPPQQRL